MGAAQLVRDGLVTLQNVNMSRVYDGNPECPEYRKAVFPALNSWMRTVFIAEEEGEIDHKRKKYVFSKVMNRAISRIERLRLENITEEVKTVSRPKPILKVKDTNDWKARALEAEAELRKVRPTVNELEGKLQQKDLEVAKLKAVLKQSVLNNIAIMSTMGVEVTQEDLGL